MKTAILMYQHLKACEVVASKDTTRAHLCGVRVIAKGKKITYVATDGHRMIVTSHKTKVKNDTIDCIIPSEMLRKLKLKDKELRGACINEFFETNNDEAAIRLSLLDGNNIEIETACKLIPNSFSIGGRTPDGTYPNYKNVIEALKTKGKSRIAFTTLNSSYVADFHKAGVAFLKLRNFKRGVNLTFKTLQSETSPMQVTLDGKSINHSCGDTFCAAIMSVRV